jgi:ribosome-associated heat shock protein Hsp15
MLSAHVFVSNRSRRRHHAFVRLALAFWSVPRIAAMRLDKWLWAARCFKTRASAAEACDRQRVHVNDIAAKPARELRIGDQVALREDGGVLRVLVVRALSAVRGPASVAQALYEETAASVAAREQARLARRLAPEPAAALSQGRPTKSDRRAWQRWSASLDDA